jgi:hypothetical protein
MNGERSWGVDTVALGQGGRDKAASAEVETVVLRPAAKAASEPEKRTPAWRQRGHRWHLTMAVAAGLAAVAALGSVVVGGGSPGTATRPDVASPARREAVKLPTRMRRREPQRVRRRAHRHRQGMGGRRQLEDERKPKGSATTHELTSPPESEPTSVPEAPAEIAPEPTPAPTMRPTSPAVEFGM